MKPITENYFNIILDGKIVKGIPGETILQLANRNGIEIPTLCNDERLEPYSSCFVCVVEVAPTTSRQMRTHREQRMHLLLSISM